MLPVSEDGLVDPAIQANEPTPRPKGQPVHIDPVLVAM
jgi:hypothetical protein